MFQRSVQLLAFAATVVSAAACSNSDATSQSSGGATGGTHAPFAQNGVAYAVGDPAGSDVKATDVFDVVNQRYLGSDTAFVPNAHTRIGKMVLTRDGRRLYLAAYDTQDPTREKAGLYAVDLASGRARFVASLGSGIPRDATLSTDGTLYVLMTDASARSEDRQNRLVAIGSSSNGVESLGNPLPRVANGRQPTPVSVVYDAYRKLLYLTDARGSIYALTESPLRYFRRLPGSSATFTASGASAVMDSSRSILYQLGVYSTTDAYGRYVALGALLSTTIGDGGTRLTTFPYTPVAGALLDRTGGQLFFGSYFTPSPGLPFLSRFDIASNRVVARPIEPAYGRPEFLQSGHLALSSDGTHVLVPVATGPQESPAGALLEFDPTSLTLQNSIPAPSAFQSGGVVAI